MPSFTGNKYPEELRALRAQYPNTQFDSHGRVIGGMPLDQYNTQTVAAIPASVRTYSQFDPATGTWIRHTNGAVSPVQGMTPTNTPGIYLRPKQQAQPAQVMRPLPRRVIRQNTQPSATPSDIGLGVTVTPANNGDPYVSHANENPVMPLTQPKATVRTWEQYLNRNVTPSTTTVIPVQEEAKTPLKEDMLSPTTRMRLENASIYNNLGRALTAAGKGFLGLFGWGKPTNYDPTLSNHSDPRW